MIRILTTLLLLFFCIKVYSQNRIRLLNMNNGESISDVEVIHNNTLLGLTDSNGYIYINNNIDLVLFKKRGYFDILLKFSDIQNGIVKLEPIEGIILDEVEIKYVKNLSLLDRIYKNYSSRNNYDFNYKFKNLYIDFYSKNCVFININEYYHMNKLILNNNRTLNYSIIKYNDDFYKPKNIKIDGNAEVVNCDNIDYPIPISILHKPSFFYFNEIHYFFKNYNKIKYRLVEDEYNYEIVYEYIEPYKNFKFDIILIIDKKTECIINYRKNKSDNYKFKIKNLNLVNTDVSYECVINNYVEKVYFRLNNSNKFELILEELKIEYSMFSKNNNPVNFYYDYSIEPTIEQDVSEKKLVDINTLLKKNK